MGGHFLMVKEKYALFTIHAFAESEKDGKRAQEKKARRSKDKIVLQREI